MCPLAHPIRYYPYLFCFLLALMLCAFGLTRLFPGNALRAQATAQATVTIELINRHSLPSWGADMALVDSRAYIIYGFGPNELRPHGLQILDLSAPLSPTLLVDYPVRDESWRDIQVSSSCH